MIYVRIFSRFVFGAATSVLLIWCGLWSMGVPPELPSWRLVLGFALFAGAALIFDRFINTDDEVSK